MSSTRAEAFNGLLGIYCSVFLMCIPGYFSAVYELLLLRVLCIVLIIAHLHYGICLVCFLIF